jgi:hypothetical protein
MLNLNAVNRLTAGIRPSGSENEKAFLLELEADSFFRFSDLI